MKRGEAQQRAGGRRRGWGVWWAGAAVMAVVAVNAVAFMQARRMMRFARSPMRTDAPEALRWWERAWVVLAGVTVPRPESVGRPPELAGVTGRVVRLAGFQGMELDGWFYEGRGGHGIVALFHGYAGMKDHYVGEAEGLLGEGWSVLMVDFHGSGGSAGETTSIGFHEAEDVTRVLRWARERVGEDGLVVGVGRSLGAAALMRALALGWTDVDGVVVEAPFSTVLRTVGERFRAMGLPVAPFAHLLVFWGGVQQGFWGFGHRPLEYARRVRRPTLLLCGAKDPRVPLRESEAVFEALGAAAKRMVIFPEAGHWSLYREDPGRWMGEVAKFLNEVRGNGWADANQGKGNRPAAGAGTDGAGGG